MKRETVKVGLGDRSYDIIIGDGLIDEAGERFAPLLPRARTLILTDENVWRAHGERLAASFGRAGVTFDTLVLAPGEGAKTIAGAEKALHFLLDAGVERDDMIVAFGGGVIGDLTGFAAALVKRGCRFAQIPTTLLAQVDSSVGGKTGVNTPHGKNLVGAFHQPSIVLSDVGALATLPARERAAGLAEVIKYGAIADPDFFTWLETGADAILEGKTDALIRAVARSCEMKAAIVAADERERGERALLNFGHTFGHALEAVYGFSSALLHGEAVAAGMGLAADFSVQLAACPLPDAVRLKALLRKSGLPAGLSDLPPGPALAAGRILELMQQDKKNSGGAVTLILARGIGAAYIERRADIAALRGFLEQETAQRPPQV